MKPNLLDQSLDGLKVYLKEKGEPAYRAGQIYEALLKGKTFEDMTNLSLALRGKLAEDFDALPVKITSRQVSEDGTIKYLFSLADGHLVEGVRMSYAYGHTLCLSTQVGCGQHCAFCASGIGGKIRNLTASEMLGQVIAVNGAEEGKLNHVVLMGTGEPLDNYDAVVTFLKRLNGELVMSLRNVSLSTCGLVEKMVSFAKEDLPVTLAISLHAPNDTVRKKIMPVAQRYTMEDILRVADFYAKKTGRRYIVEYALIEGINNLPEHARELAERLKGRLCHVNLIALNEIDERPFKGCSKKEMYRFAHILEAEGISVTVRRKLGEDIDGACGQLRRKFMNAENEEEEVEI